MSKTHCFLTTFWLNLFNRNTDKGKCKEKIRFFAQCLSEQAFFAMDISRLTAAADTLTSILTSGEEQKEKLAQGALVRGLSCLQEKKYDRAIREFKLAVYLKPTFEEAFEYLGKIYQINGQEKEALETFKRWVSSSPLSEKAITALGNIYIGNQQYKEAEIQFKRLLQINPSSAYAYNSLGHIYLNTDRCLEAEGQFKKVIQLAPGDANGYYGLGLTLNKLKRYEEAIEQFEKAIGLKKKFEFAYSDLAYAYLGLGNKEKAREQIETLNDLNTSLAKSLALELELALYTPKILGVKPLDGSFPSVLGPGTPLTVLNPDLSEANQSKIFSITFQFNQAMDVQSVQNPLNWMIFKAQGGPAGFYNNGITLNPQKEVGPHAYAVPQPPKGGFPPPYSLHGNLRPGLF